MKIVQEKILITFPSYLIALLPLFLISGPFLSDLSVVIIGLIADFAKDKLKNYNKYSHMTSEEVV